MREFISPSLRHIESQTQTVAWGIGFMLSGMLIMPIMDAIAKHLGGALSPIQISWGRFFFQFLIMACAIVALKGVSALVPKRPIIQGVRGVLLAIATCFFFFSLKFLPLADAMAIFFIQPMILTLLSAVFLGETIGWHRKTAVCTGFLGALLIIQPGADSFTLAAMLPIGAAFFFSCYMAVTRSVADIDPPLTMQFASGLGAVVALSIALIPGTYLSDPTWGAQAPKLGQWGYLAAIGLIAAVGHLLVVLAVIRAPASVIAPFGYIEIIAATALGWWVFGDWPNNLSWVGIIIIVASGFYVFIREQKRLPNGLPNDSSSEH